VVSSPYYDNPYWEFHLPINPPIAPGKDLDMDGNEYVYDGPSSIDIGNWTDETGAIYHIDRIRETGINRHSLTKESRVRMISAVTDDDEEYDCD
jgi:hypothetical protein